MFHVLTAHGTDAKVWDSYIEMLPYDLRDVHFTAGWGRVQEAAEPTASARVAVLADHERGEVTLQPFLLRSIEGTKSFDMSAGGYGGIVTSSALPSAEHGAALERELSAWREQNQVIAEFYLVNPVFAGHQLMLARGAGGTMRPVKDVVVLHTGPEEKLRAGMKPTRRHAHQKAELVLVGQMDAANFAKLYGGAMVRKNAAPRWRFGQAYFEALLTIDHAAEIYGAAPPADGDTHYPAQAAAAFTFGKSVAYYHLAATIEDPSPGWADMLVMVGAKEANARGCDWLHLGGGVTSAKDDSLLAYKRSFGGMQRVVYAVQRVFDEVTYGQLCGDAGEASDAPGFFPAYRAKEAQAA